MYKLHNNKDINRTLNHVVKQITKLTETQLKHIQNLTRIGESLSSETNLDKIFNLILREAIAITNADAATIYRVGDDQMFLEFAIVYNKTLNINLASSDKPVTWQSIPLFDDKGKPRLDHIVTNVYHKKRLLCFEDVYETKNFDISGTKSIDEANNYRSKSMLTIPLKNHEDEVLGIIQIINVMDRPGHVVPFTKEQIISLKSLASQAAIAMSNRKLINDLESLLMQFMYSIAKAIERKSKYSSAHITKVAMITDMIANKINESKTGKFSHFSFSQNELKELFMAGLMHDIGKIVTPVYIMDKSTKLETITDRIHLVKLRFELFKKALSLHKNDKGETTTVRLARKWYPDKPPLDFKELLSNLNKDMSFLKQVNLGSESLTDEQKKRITNIGKIEFAYNGEEWNLLSKDEVNNLQIRRGTLTTEEKKTMDDHVKITWEMLSKLTFPKKYKNVAFYAASHHEKLNGKGHPFGLKAEQLPTQSRILAIADIFEALTAMDRPYKTPKPLSEALKIMAACARDKEIDSDILDVFIDSGAYKEFARKHMDKKLINKMDIRAIKKIYHSE